MRKREGFVKDTATTKWWLFLLSRKSSQRVGYVADENVRGDRSRARLRPPGHDCAWRIVEAAEAVFFCDTVFEPFASAAIHSALFLLIYYPYN